jgi:tetratricopeptide (TPR) repeat protein
MNEKLETSFKQIIASINNNELIKAKDQTKILISKHPSSDTSYNLMGIINLKLNEYENAIRNFLHAIKINDQFISAMTNLAICYKKINNFDEAIITLKKITSLKPNMYEVFNEIGTLYNKQKKYKNAEKYFLESISLNNNYAHAYFNIGLLNLEKKDYSNAIVNFKKTLDIDKNFIDATYYLGECYRKLKKFHECYKFYNMSNNPKKNYKILQSLYEEGNLKRYSEELERISIETPNDRRIAALTAFVSNQNQIRNNFPFCPNPIDFVYISSISKYKKNYNSFINSLLTEISKQKFSWEPSGKTTVKGFGTYNLSEYGLPVLSELKKIIFVEIENYFQTYSDKNINFIKERPNNLRFVSWSNILKKEGYNVPHIHPSGWISGVFYLKVPSKIKKNEAGIQFHLNGDDYEIINKNMPNKIVKPEIGTMVLFPSSLYHSTVPFTSDEERICIAFDLCGTNN